MKKFSFTPIAVSAAAGDATPRRSVVETVRAQNNQPAAVVDLRGENERLRSTVTELRRANHELTEATKRFARIVHVLEVENQQLREHATDPRPTTNSGNVHLLRQPPRDPD